MGGENHCLHLLSSTWCLRCWRLVTASSRPALAWCRGCVAKDTVQWVRDTAAGLPHVPTSLAFIHIPLPQFMGVWVGGVG